VSIGWDSAAAISVYIGGMTVLYFLDRHSGAADDAEAKQRRKKVYQE
jgi:hypothetical protein